MTESVLRLVPLDHNIDPLDDLANKIGEKLGTADDLSIKADGLSTKAYNARIAAGKLLLEARDLCQQRGEPWEAWCKKNVCIYNRSLRDIRKIMAMAGAPNPEAAHNEEKETARLAMAKHRSNVRPVSQESSVELDLAALQDAVKALSTADFTAFKVWFFSYCGR